ncbi:MAG: PEP-CTERM sorting domain-containing protein [Candidatus Omnitrophica bacterium]|nr:PEP-CTERM sorting domain-containing protein [Candidatus Omnitrophota bacterium]
MRKTVLFLIGALVISFPAYAITWLTPNLVVNPGAETGDTSGWEVYGPAYATTSQSQSTGTVLPHSGDYFFSYAQNAASDAVLVQYADVSTFAGLIDSGQAYVQAGFWYQTEEYQGSSDEAFGSLGFFEGDSSDMPFDVLTSDPLVSSSWAYTEVMELIPAGTRTIGLAMIGELESGSYVNAFFDDAQLRVGTETVIPEPATLLLLGSGLLGLGGTRLRRRKR